MDNQKLETRIIDFINEHHVLTLATVKNTMPYCANCFYVFLEDENCFVFTSDKKTKHAQDALMNRQVAGSVVLETRTVGKIQGIQFVGQVALLEGDLKKKASRAYLKRFPYAILKQTDMWAVSPSFLKMTDNRLGFGKKLIWGQLPEE